MASAADLNEMLVFARVVQAGSFIGASRELDMPSSTVSRKVADLERRLDARLLQRTTRTLSLTDVGQAYYQHAARIVAEVEEAEQAVTRMQQLPRGLLRVTAPVSFGHLGAVVASFLAQHPEVQIELLCADRVIDLVHDGLDVGIRVGNLHDSTLVARSLGAVRNIVVASPSYIEEHGSPKRPSDLAEHDCIAFGASRHQASWTLTCGSKTVSTRVKTRLTVNDFDYLEDAARTGIGVALLPTYRSAEDISTGRLVRLLPDWCSPELPLHAVFPSRRHLSPKVRAFVDHVREHMKFSV
jgi:DNA-binding transcriptional LysR family regulator